MDPNLVSVLTGVLAGIFGGATGEVGAESVRELLALVRGLPADEAGGSPADLERSIIGGRAETAEDVAEALVARAAENPKFDRELRAWLTTAKSIQASSVTNTITGSVGGNVIQAGEINIDSVRRAE